MPKFCIYIAFAYAFTYAYAWRIPLHLYTDTLPYTFTYICRYTHTLTETFTYTCTCTWAHRQPDSQTGQDRTGHRTARQTDSQAAKTERQTDRQTCLVSRQGSTERQTHTYSLYIYIILYINVYIYVDRACFTQIQICVYIIYIHTLNFQGIQNKVLSLKARHAEVLWAKVVGTKMQKVYCSWCLHPQKKCAKRKLSRHASNCQHVGPGIHGPFTLWEVLSRCGRSFSRWFTRPKLMHWDWGTPICRTNETFVLFFESSHESNLDWLIAVVLNWPASVEGELGNFKQFGQHPSWVVLGK